MKKILIFNLLLSLCLITTTRVSAKFEKQIMAAQKGCSDMALAWPDWARITLDKKPLICYNLENDTTLYIFRVYKGDSYLGYVAVN